EMSHLISRDVTLRNFFGCYWGSSYNPFVISTNSSKHARYICMICYEKKGGHIYQRIGRGVKKDPNCNNMSHHKNDTKEALEAIGYWILSVANSDKIEFQEKILAQLTPILCAVNTQKSAQNDKNEKNEVPTLLMILIIFALVKFDYNFDKKLDPKNLKPKHF